jgi:hypothetical protein
MAQHGRAAEREEMEQAPEHALDVRILFSLFKIAIAKKFCDF